MGKPKKRTSSRRTGMRRSHEHAELAKRVNARSPVKVHLNARQRAKATAELKSAA